MYRGLITNSFPHSVFGYECFCSSPDVLQPGTPDIESNTKNMYMIFGPNSQDIFLEIPCAC